MWSAESTRNIFLFSWRPLLEQSKHCPFFPRLKTCPRPFSHSCKLIFFSFYSCPHNYMPSDMKNVNQVLELGSSLCKIGISTNPNFHRDFSMTDSQVCSRKRSSSKKYDYLYSTFEEKLFLDQMTHGFFSFTANISSTFLT